MTVSKVLAVAVAAVLTLGACGGSESGSGDPELEAAIAAEILAEADDSIPVDADQADCVAGEIVSALGTDRLEELGVTSDSVPAIEDVEFTLDEANSVVDGYADCVDLLELMKQDMAADAGDEAADCFVDAMGLDTVKAVIASEMAGSEPDSEVDAAFTNAAIECL